jgi:hypothetical protein
VDVALAVATRDPRVVAAAFLDGYAYPTAGYRLRNALAYLYRPGASLDRIVRAVRRRPLPGSATSGTGDFFERHYPTHETFRHDVLAMSDRRTQLLYAFSYRWWYFNHRAQFAAMLGLRRLPPNLVLEYWTDADHLFTGVPVRRRIVLRLADWLSSTYSTRESGVPHESIDHVA